MRLYYCNLSNNINNITIHNFIKLPNFRLFLRVYNNIIIDYYAVLFLLLKRFAEHNILYIIFKNKPIVLTTMVNKKVSYLML